MSDDRNETNNRERKSDGCKPSVLSDLLCATNRAQLALLCAKETIHAFHGELAWDIYETNSPEMKLINDAINRLGKAIVLGGG